MINDYGVILAEGLPYRGPQQTTEWFNVHYICKLLRGDEQGHLHRSNHGVCLFSTEKSVYSMICIMDPRPKVSLITWT